MSCADSAIPLAVEFPRAVGGFPAGMIAVRAAGVICPGGAATALLVAKRPSHGCERTGRTFRNRKSSKTSPRVIVAQVTTREGAAPGSYRNRNAARKPRAPFSRTRAPAEPSLAAPLRVPAGLVLQPDFVTLRCRGTG